MTIFQDIKPDLDNYLGARSTLIDTMTRAFRNGAPAMQVWRSVAPAFSRDQVKQYLASVALHDAAHKASKQAGLGPSVAVSLTGIDAPREAHLSIAADPEETPGDSALAQRIRGALRDFHITLDLPQGEHDEITDSLVDELLLDGEPVRLIKLKPLT
ncbi:MULTISPECIES: hypothetical protein [unclassified Nocardiopsis]|uniref:hypothetical protein n=1 Tax=unclassified Nocardiopsis TaxID=2649073 RepID=UPI0013569D9D|nr:MULTISPECIES: hypothetical protein [unclassified Nocardiopsis]